MSLITAPAEPVVTVVEAKAHLRIDTDDEDSLISSYIEVATAHFDGYYGVLRRALKPQTWEWTIDAFPSRVLEIPLLPLIAVTTFSYSDSGGLDVSVDAESYTVDVPFGWIVPAYGYSWPYISLAAANAVSVLFTAGYPDIASTAESDGFRSGIPPPIRHAILLMVGDMYEHRETVAAPGVLAVPMSATIDRLIAPYKRYFVPA